MWIKPSGVEDEGVRLAFMIWGYVAVDMERRLVLSTTDGRTRNARRWFVHTMNADYTTNRNVGRVNFRAWTRSEAIERLNEPAIQKRIEKLLAGKLPADEGNHG